MIPQLKPDIYNCIADHLTIRPAPHDDPATKEIVQNQAGLLSLMKANKLLYDICGPKLYSHCSIGNLSSLRYGLDHDHHLINRIERLHLYSGSYSDEPSYFDLLSDNLTWLTFTTPHQPVKEVNGSTAFSLVEESRYCIELGKQLRELIRSNVAVLPRLRTLSLGDIANVTHNMKNAPKHESDMLGSPLEHLYKMMPRLLINLPSVDHVCQTGQFGPLALVPVRSGVYKMANPPAVFNYHPTLPSVHCSCSEVIGPIFVGAINRHFYNCIYAIEDIEPNMWTVIQESRIIGEISQFFDSPTFEYDPNDETHLTESDDLGDTKVELYDYFRVTLPIPGGRPKFQVPRGYSIRGARPATSLEHWQSLLDEALPQKWKGRVIFKNREEAPPCTACDWDMKEEWRRRAESEEYYRSATYACDQAHF